jgi:PAS domain S-box-containing protein
VLHSAKVNTDAIILKLYYNKLITLLKLVLPKDKEKIRQAIRNAIEKQLPYWVEYRLVYPDTTVYIASTAKVVYENNKSVRMMGTVVDITERKLAEQQTLNSEKRFRALLESAPDAMIIADQEGYITLANAQTKKIFGYTDNELLGKPVDILIPVQGYTPSTLVSIYHQSQSKKYGTWIGVKWVEKRWFHFSGGSEFESYRDSGRYIHCCRHPGCNRKEKSPAAIQSGTSGNQ